MIYPSDCNTWDYKLQPPDDPTEKWMEIAGDKSLKIIVMDLLEWGVPLHGGTLRGEDYREWLRERWALEHCL